MNILEQTALVKESIARLDHWMTRYGWAGYDPYDLKQHPFLSSTSGSAFSQRVLRQILLITESFFPSIPRKALRIPKTVNPKAMGLFAAGYQVLYEATRNTTYLEKAQRALQWLEENPCQGYHGLCWGHPFRWQSKIPIPKDTPSSVITAIIGDAFWRSYQNTQDHRFLHHCQSICEFFLRDLNIDVLGEDSLCFSKTPLDHFHIHNGNLFVADFLIKVGKVSGRKDYLEMAEKALTYTLKQQNENGSLCYWGKDQEKECKIDHYHSGFEIRGLYSIWKSMGDPKVYEALKKYYRFYCENLFTSERLPKMTPRSFYPVNIHSCAEAILCHSTLAPDFPEALGYLQQCVPWTLRVMQDGEGWFIYMVRKVQGQFDWKLKIPYIRWGQAWMLRALAEYYSLILKSTKLSPSSGENTSV
jgi:hypothetical protein